MRSSYEIRNLIDDIDDSAAKFGFGHIGEARFANDELATEQTGLSLHRINPGQRQGFGHRHQSAEEVYVVLSGGGRVRLDDEIRDVSGHDAIRVDAGVTRAFAAGPEGLEVLAFGPRRPDDRGEMLTDWWTD